MNTLTLSLGVLAAIAAAAGLYGLHRLALRLEEGGHIYYLRKSPKGGASGGFVAMQRIIEPQAEHIFVVHEHAAPAEDEEGAGPPRIHSA